MNISFKGSLVIIDESSKKYCIVNPNDISIVGNKKLCSNTSNYSGCATAFDVFVRGIDTPVMNVQKPVTSNQVGKSIDHVNIVEIADAVERAKKSDTAITYILKNPFESN